MKNVALKRPTLGALDTQPWLANDGVLSTRPSSCTLLQGIDAPSGGGNDARMDSGAAARAHVADWHTTPLRPNRADTKAEVRRSLMWTVDLLDQHYVSVLKVQASGERPLLLYVIIKINKTVGL